MKGLELLNLPGRNNSIPFFLANIEWILPISTVIVILIYYFDKKRKNKDDENK
ncbi:hypothetical protein [Aliarcobacter cryaerophilus]|uniref:hypothetical protein n=1 Tax=Aliarcobacter cryaerophilus TaxID=28198 RepID=UPI000A8AA174|nr:hypothetical protein [Aliarcobacter cryaerophilus]